MSLNCVLCDKRLNDRRRFDAWHNVYHPHCGVRVRNSINKHIKHFYSKEIATLLLGVGVTLLAFCKPSSLGLRMTAYSDDAEAPVVLDDDLRVYHAPPPWSLVRLLVALNPKEAKHLLLQSIFDGAMLSKKNALAPSLTT